MEHYTAEVVVVGPPHRSGLVGVQMELCCSTDSAAVGTEFDFLEFQICF